MPTAEAAPRATGKPPRSIRSRRRVVRTRTMAGRWAAVPRAAARRVTEHPEATELARMDQLVRTTGVPERLHRARFGVSCSEQIGPSARSAFCRSAICRSAIPSGRVSRQLGREKKGRTALLLCSLHERTTRVRACVVRSATLWVLAALCILNERCTATFFRLPFFGSSLPQLHCWACG